ncbi:protein kinase [Plasmodium brasilianum]|uniref:Protein kinase, putative n=3 Tax=Plasmodium (Plasmodium) TaxID=418103 RepID=A0A1D3SQM5_PLAMA|nr:protein kinase, putative [Plasmodium malariae]KAI4836895.1 protein kinase [Plasmodium brasilianum]SCO94196.1 protein kinase, putative [Plasmodium malariae]
MHFLNNIFEKTKIHLEFRKKLDEKLNEHIKSGIIIANEKFSGTKQGYRNSRIKLSNEFIENCNEKLLLDILKINKKLKLCYDVKYHIIYSVLLKRCRKNNSIGVEKKYEQIMNNVYKIKRKNTSYFMNQYLIIKCIYTGEFGNVYYCRDVIENKNYCLKIFYLGLCLKENCPYYINDQVYLTNHFCKILNEIFFLNYLENKNIIHIEKIFFDEKKKILFAIFPYVKYQSMYYKKKYGIYSIYNKTVCIDKKHVQINLYSENFLGHLFLNIYNTLIYLLQKSVAYVDLKPDNILLTKRNKEEIASYIVHVKKKKITKTCALTKCLDLASIETNIKKKLIKSSKIEYKKDDGDASSFNKKIFLSRKKKRTNEIKGGHSYCLYKKLNTEKLKNKKIKYLYNINLSQCFEYNNNVKRIFFIENKLSNIFFSADEAAVYIQTFIQRKKTEESNFLEPKKGIVCKKYKNTTINSIKPPTKRCQINKIKNLSIFKYMENNSVSFLKFYWLYFNQDKIENVNKDFLIYLDIHFINKYFYEGINTNNNILDLFGKQELKRHNKSKMNKNQESKKQHNSENTENSNIINSENSEKGELQKQDNKQFCFSESEINNMNLMKLIDFDTCSFILKNFSTHIQATDIFNSFEYLFNVNNKVAQLSKKLSYNFGSVLYTFLFGKTPYYGDNIFEIYRNMKNGKLVFPKYRKIDINLKHLLRNLLNNNPDKRMQFKKIKRHIWFSKFE